MALPTNLRNVLSRGRATDAEVGAALVDLGTAGEGFPVGTMGYLGTADPYRAWAIGEVVYVRGTAHFYVVVDGATTKVAVQFPNNGATITGAGLVYVVAPAALGITNSYPTVSAAVAAIGANKGMILVLPGTYVEPAGPTLLIGQYSILGTDWNNTIVTNAQFRIDTIDTISFANICLTGDGVNSAIVMNAGFVATLSLDHVNFAAAAVPSINAQGGTSTIRATACRSASPTFITASGQGPTLYASGFDAHYPLRTVLATALYLQNCYVDASPVFFNSSEIVDCVLTSGCTSLTFQPQVAGRTLRVTRTTFVHPGGPDAFVIEGTATNAGTVVLTGVSASRDSTNGPWVTTYHTAVADGVPNGSWVQALTPAVSAVLPSLIDIAEVAASATGVVMELPPANTDIQGRRYTVKNTGTRSFGIAAALGQFLDNNSSIDVLYVQPQDVLEMYCDRASGVWRRFTRHGSPTTYAVAKDLSKVPGAFQTVQQALNQFVVDGVSVGVVEVYPGTYTEAITNDTSLSVTLRGMGAAPEQVVISGQTTLSQGAGPATGLENLTFNFTGTASNVIYQANGGGGASLPLRAINCRFVGDSVGVGVLTAAVAQDVEVTLRNCTFASAATGYGFAGSGGGAFQLLGCRFETAACVNAVMSTSGLNTRVENCWFEGGLQLTDGIVLSSRFGVIDPAVSDACVYNTAPPTRLLIAYCTFYPSSSATIIVRTQGTENTVTLGPYTVPEALPYAALVLAVTGTQQSGGAAYNFSPYPYRTITTDNQTLNPWDRFVIVDDAFVPTPILVLTMCDPSGGKTPYGFDVTIWNLSRLTAITLGVGAGGGNFSPEWAVTTVIPARSCLVLRSNPPIDGSYSTSWWQVSLSTF